LPDHLDVAAEAAASTHRAAQVRPAARALVPRCAQRPIGWTHRRLRQLPDGDSSLSARCGASAFTTRRKCPCMSTSFEDGDPTLPPVPGPHEPDAHVWR